MQSRNPRILIVDDEAAIRWAIRQRLNEDAYDILEAGIASEALDRLVAAEIELVLLDARLPDSDVEAVVNGINRLQPTVQIILLTEAAMIDRAIALLRRGVYDYVAKPLNLDEIAVRVARALEVTALRREVQALRASQQSRSHRRSRGSMASQ